jgi:predicted transcriptional regulator
MTGRRPFSELTKDFTPARRARVAAKAAALREAMTLEELRKARSLSQEDVAEALTVNQPAVAKLEKRGDMHVSNLSSVKNAAFRLERAEARRSGCRGLGTTKA